MRRKKVLHIDNSTHLTGAFKALLGICDELKGQYDSIIALPRNSQCDKIAGEKGIQWTKFSFYEIRKNAKALFLYLPYLLLNVQRVSRYIRKNKIDILHANDHFNLVPVLVKMVLGKRIKLVVHVRLLPSTYNYQLYSLFRTLNTRYADKLIAVSEAIYKAYHQPSGMIMIRDRITLQEKLPVYIPQQRDVFRFVYVSNYIQGKGQDFAVDAFLRVAASHQNAEMHFYGGNMGLEKNRQYKNALIEKIKEARLENRVFFNDFEANTEAVYKSGDASLCFSESESFSLICIESQFYGIPVIASASGGPQEIIQNMENGILVENRNVDEMAAAMQLLISNFALRQKLSAGGKKRARELMQSTPSFQSVLDNL